MARVHPQGQTRDYPADLVHSSQVQHQLRFTVSLQDHRDAPVLLVEVAGCVIRDLAVLCLGAIASRGAGRDVKDSLWDVR